MFLLDGARVRFKKTSDNITEFKAVQILLNFELRAKVSVI